MRTKLQKHGNSLALVIPKEVRALHGIKASTPFEMKSNGRFLVLMPIQKRQDRDEDERVMRKVFDEYNSLFEKLSKV